MEETFTIPETIVAAARAHAGSSPRDVHRLKVDLAELVLSHAEPSAASQLGAAQRFLRTGESRAALIEARQDCWATIGTMACYCTLTDSSSAQAILCCLEPEDSQHTQASLFEQTARVLRCGVPAERVLAVLRSFGVANSHDWALGPAVKR